MTTTSARRALTTPRLIAGRQAVILLAAAAVAVAANLVIAAVATAAGSPVGYTPLSAAVLSAFTVVPIVVGWFAWQWVARRVRSPRRTLTLLVVAVLVLSYVPDVVLAVTGFIPGTTTPGVIGLMAAHLIVMGSAVAGYVLASRR